MTSTEASSPAPPSSSALEQYYQLHSRIYDLTRWSFLFGREEVLHRAARVIQPARVLEVGCGTGRNLVSLRRRFPAAHLAGVDLSAPMLDIARAKLQDGRAALLRQAYAAPVHEAGKPFDLVVCSYALSMFNPGWEQAIDAAAQDLNEGGCIAVVDFSDTAHGWFRRWMGMNHVRMENHLWPRLRERFAPLIDERLPAYGGLWTYGLFIGRKQS